MDKHSVQIKAGQGYKVSVGSGLLTQCGQDLAALLPSRRIAIITDSTVEKLYLPAARSSLEQAGFQVSSFSFPAGESSKTVYTLAQILEFLAAQQLTRQDCLAALGGGVVGDITGFAAGCYLRGIHYVQLPTTLLGGGGFLCRRQNCGGSAGWKKSGRTVYSTCRSDLRYGLFGYPTPGDSGRWNG